MSQPGSCPLCGTARTDGSRYCPRCSFDFLAAELGAERLFLRKLAASGFALFVYGVPVIAFLLVASKEPEVGQEPGLVVVGGAFVAGLALGIAAWALGGPYWATGNQSARTTKFSWGFVLTTAGSAILLRQVLPEEIAGWPTALVFLMFGLGFMWLVLPGGLLRLFSRPPEPTGLK
jgi:hypothetical protein